MIRLFDRQQFGTSIRLLLAAVLTGTVALGGTLSALAEDAVEQQQLVDKAKMTLESFLADPSMGPALRDLKQDTKAIYIVPQILRGAFIFGGAGGSGVLLVRDEATKKWSEPAFYNIGSASFGLQAGGDVSETIFIVRNQRGLEQFYRHDFKLGLDASMALGPVGEGGSMKGITADLIGYARKKGAFVGMSVNGSIIAVSDDSNEAYYGKPVRPTDIIVKHAVSNPKSADLRNAAAKF
ncbi:MAG: lipid-binding SYLF domain-containing protein [Nitrospira sp.]|nr:lipid-binding SYLF domain-containing protein [Nitrospira sp.]